MYSRECWNARYFVLIQTKNRVRALGETDLNPVSGLGKISQLIFAVVQPSNIVANLVAGGVSPLSFPFDELIYFPFKRWRRLVHNSELTNR